MFSRSLFYSQQVHEHVLRVLESPCHPGRARQDLSPRLPASNHVTQPFLWKDVPLHHELFLYPPPFGFKGLSSKVEDLLKKVNKKTVFIKLTQSFITSRMFLKNFGVFLFFVLNMLMTCWLLK